MGTLFIDSSTLSLDLILTGAVNDFRVQVLPAQHRF